MVSCAKIRPHVIKTRQIGRNNRRISILIFVWSEFTGAVPYRRRRRRIHRRCSSTTRSGRYLQHGLDLGERTLFEDFRGGAVFLLIDAGNSRFFCKFSLRLDLGLLDKLGSRFYRLEATNSDLAQLSWGEMSRAGQHGDWRSEFDVKDRVRRRDGMNGRGAVSFAEHDFVCYRETE
jgi:hypothetical protein